MHLSFYIEDLLHKKTLLTLVQKVVYGGFLLIPQHNTVRTFLRLTFVPSPV